MRVILIWAQEKKISERGRNCLLTPEQLVLLFIAFVEKEMADSCVLTTTEDEERVRQLLLANHFHDCELWQCPHLGTLRYEQRDNRVKADALLRFLHHYSRLRGQLIKDSHDVSFREQEVNLVQLADPQYGRIAERMLQAYYTLASTASLKELLQISVNSLKEHRVIPLSRQAASVVFFVEEYYEEKLRRTSGATSVKVLRKRFRNTMAGLYLDVWGDQRSLLLIEDNVRDLEQMSPLYARSTASVERQLIHGAYFRVFENSAGPSAELAFHPHNTGLVQASHESLQENGMIHVPRLLNPYLSDAYSMEKFVNSVMQQVDFLNQTYDETLFGKLRAVISYGTCYVIADKPPAKMNEEQFVKRLSVALPTNNENLVNPDPGIRSSRALRASRGMGRSRTTGRAAYTYSSMTQSFSNLSFNPSRRAGRQRSRVGRLAGSTSDRYSNTSTHLREGFIPAREFQTERFYAFLRDNGFNFNENYKVYLITVHPKLSGYQLNINSILVLDEQMRLNELTMTDTKWICVNVYTDKSRCAGSRAANDIRFRIHSRVSWSPLDMAKHDEDCSDLIENHRDLLILDQHRNVIGVHPKYRSRIHFVRYKNSSVYQLAENPQVCSSLCRL